MKILYWILKSASIILLSPVVIIAIPGAVLHFIAEEVENHYD
jgi:hypothetical protein